MNSQATPITQPAEEESSNLVNDILNELNQAEEEVEAKPEKKQQATPLPASEYNQVPMGVAPSSSLSMANEANMNNARLNYQMDPHIQPVPPIAGPPRPGMPPIMTAEQAAAYAAAVQANNSGLESMLQNIVNEAREPLLVALLFVILNQNIVHRLIMKYIPRLSAGDKLTTFGIILLALLGGILFYLLRFMNKSS